MSRTKDFDEGAVLNKALQLFWTKGYAATSAQDLVDALGISRSSLYDTFTDKRNLYIRALEQYRKQKTGAMVEMIDAATNIEELIRDMLKFVTSESIHDKQTKGCFMVNATIELAPQDKEIAAIINHNIEDVEDALTRAVKRGQESGQVSAHHSPRAIARFIYNTISGLRVTAKSGADKKVLDDIVKVSMGVIG